MSQRSKAEKRVKNERNEFREVKVCHPQDRYGRNLIEHKRDHRKAQRRADKAIVAESELEEGIHPAEEALWEYEASLRESEDQ